MGPVHVAAPANRRDDGLLVATLDTTTAVGVLPERPVVEFLAGIGQRRDRLRPAAAAHLELLPLTDPTPPALTPPGAGP